MCLWVAASLALLLSFTMSLPFRHDTSENPSWPGSQVARNTFGCSTIKGRGAARVSNNWQPSILSFDFGWMPVKIKKWCRDPISVSLSWPCVPPQHVLPTTEGESHLRDCKQGQLSSDTRRFTTQAGPDNFFSCFNCYVFENGRLFFKMFFEIEDWTKRAQPNDPKVILGSKQ